MKTRIASMAGACAVALAFAVPGSFALADQDRVYGGWEEHGATPMATVQLLSSPQHHGEAQYANFSGTDHKRAYGWTIWPGTYHYTRARLEFGSRVVADSGRKWGWNETHAWSGWYAARKDSGWPSARTYYGR